jgi:hypothetical protein
MIRTQAGNAYTDIIDLFRVVVVWGKSLRVKARLRQRKINGGILPNTLTTTMSSAATRERTTSCYSSEP